jgi:hypothetical protein
MAASVFAPADFRSLNDSFAGHEFKPNLSFHDLPYHEALVQKPGGPAPPIALEGRC